MKLKLIDEDWIDKYLSEEDASISKYPIGDERFTKAVRNANLLREIKKQLQSPVEEIIKAFEAAKKKEDKGDMSEYMNYKYVSVNEYLKEKGYE